MILTDIDDVVLDWMGPFCAFLRKRGIPYTEQKAWALESWVGYPDPRKLVIEFNNSEAFATLPPLPGAQAYLKRLARHHVVVAISCCGVEYTLPRVRNLVHHFGKTFQAIECLPLGASKLETLRRYPPSWWLEDRLENAVAGVQAGHKAILLERALNRQSQHPQVIRARSWQAIYDLLNST